ncbi:reverse transcriptase domain-containing protein [Tanacetum coccineum]
MDQSTPRTNWKWSGSDKTDKGFPEDIFVGQRKSDARGKSYFSRRTPGKDPGRPVSDEALREYCDRNYHQILPIIAEKYTKRSRSGSLEPRHGRSESPKKKGPEKKAVFKRLEIGVFQRLGDKGKSVSVHSDDSRSWSHHSSRRDVESCHQSSRSRATESASERRYNKRTSLRRTEEFIKKVWFDDLPKETIDNYDDLKKAFLENYLQQKKCIKDPVEIYNIRQKDGESTEEFMRRYKLECRCIKGSPECMKISGFMHGITNPELIKRLHDKIPKSVDEMMRVTTSFLRGEVAASNHERKKSFPSWKQQVANQRQSFKKGGF